jgi:hypothetical protein
LALQLAALLHDADDKKYFKTDKTKENAAKVIAGAVMGSNFDAK